MWQSMCMRAWKQNIAWTRFYRVDDESCALSYGQFVLFTNTHTSIGSITSWKWSNAGCRNTRLHWNVRGTNLCFSRHKLFPFILKLIELRDVQSSISRVRLWYHWFDRFRVVQNLPRSGHCNLNIKSFARNSSLPNTCTRPDNPGNGFQQS